MDVSILIADDHAVVREGTRNILEQEPGLLVVGEAGDGVEAVALAERLKPDVAIIDIDMPRMDGIEATRQIKVKLPRCAVLIFSAYDDDQFFYKLIDAGAAGYLLKSVRGRDVVEAVRALANGESVLHPQITRKLLNRFAQRGARATNVGARDLLSEREVEVLKLVTHGLSNSDIADRLCLSPRTVQVHLGHIFNKLQVSSRTEAVVRALKVGLGRSGRTRMKLWGGGFGGHHQNPYDHHCRLNPILILRLQSQGNNR